MKKLNGRSARLEQVLQVSNVRAEIQNIPHLEKLLQRHRLVIDSSSMGECALSFETCPVTLGMPLKSTPANNTSNKVESA